VNAVKILLVEDSRALRLTSQRALTNAGYEVISAEDGESALQYARNEEPGLILFDLLFTKNQRVGGSNPVEA
jgi:DNA-binding response OmpR family regulator